MKKIITLVCLICLSVCVLAACGESTPSSLEGSTYVLRDVAVKVSDSMSAEDQKTMKDSLSLMNPDYKDMTLDQIINDMMGELVNSLKESDAKFVFKEDGVVESSSKDEGSSTGTYEKKDGKWYITMDGDTLEAKLSGNAMYIQQETDGIVVVMKMVRQ